MAKDPNIANELGHTYYPKIVYPNGEKKPGVIVQDADEEAKVMPSKKAAPAWTPGKE